MMRFRKVYNLKIISIVIFALLVTEITYGMSLSDQSTHLRKKLDYDGKDGTSRFLSTATMVKETINNKDKNEGGNKSSFLHSYKRTLFLVKYYSYYLWKLKRLKSSYIMAKTYFDRPYRSDLSELVKIIKEIGEHEVAAKEAIPWLMVIITNLTKIKRGVIKRTITEGEKASLNKICRDARISFEDYKDDKDISIFYLSASTAESLAKIGQDSEEVFDFFTKIQVGNVENSYISKSAKIGLDSLVRTRAGIDMIKKKIIDVEEEYSKALRPTPHLRDPYAYVLKYAEVRYDMLDIIENMPGICEADKYIYRIRTIREDLAGYLECAQRAKDHWDNFHYGYGSDEFSKREEILSKGLDFLKTLDFKSKDFSECLTTLKEIVSQSIPTHIFYKIDRLFLDLLKKAPDIYLAEIKKDENFIKALINQENYSKSTVLFVLGYPTEEYIYNRLGRKTELDWEEELDFLVTLAAIDYKNPYLEISNPEYIEGAAERILDFFEKSKRSKKKVKKIIKELLFILEAEKDMTKKTSHTLIPYMFMLKFTPLISAYGDVDDLVKVQKIILHKRVMLNKEMQRSMVRLKRQLNKESKIIGFNRSPAEDDWKKLLEIVNLCSVFSLNGLVIFEIDLANPNRSEVFPQQEPWIDKEYNRTRYAGQDWSHLGEKLFSEWHEYSTKARDIKLKDRGLKGDGIRAVVNYPLFCDKGYIKLPYGISEENLKEFLNILLLNKANLNKRLILPKVLSKNLGISDKTNLKEAAEVFGLEVNYESSIFFADTAEELEQKREFKKGFSKTVKVGNELGIHAAVVVETAAIAESYPIIEAFIEYDERQIEITDREKLLGANIEQGDEVIIRVEKAPEAVDLLTELTNLFRQKDDGEISIIYDLKDAPLDSEIVCKKGYNLIRMVKIGLPVPPGFIIRADRDITLQILESLLLKWASKFDIGDNERGGRIYTPVSVRSSPRVSAPGMLDTFLNVGMECEIAEKMGEIGWKIYADYLKDFAIHILEVPQEHFEAKDIKDIEDYKILAERHSSIIIDHLGFNEYEHIKAPPEAFPTLRYINKVWNVSFVEQIVRTSLAVRDSCNNPGVKEYLRLQNMPEDLPVAIIIQKMVFGNKDGNSGSFVLSTFDPVTKKEGIFIEYVQGMQGDAIVGGEITPKPLEESGIKKEQMEIIKQDVEKLRKEFGSYIKVEGTIESGKIWYLQCNDFESGDDILKGKESEVPALKKGPIVIARGASSKINGKIFKFGSIEDLPRDTRQPYILVFRNADKMATQALLSVLDKELPVAGIITEFGGKQTHFATVIHKLNSLGYNIAYISGIGFEAFDSGDMIMMDLIEGVVHKKTVSPSPSSHRTKIKNDRASRSCQ